MGSTTADKRTVLAEVIRAMEEVRRGHHGETHDEWLRAVDAKVREAEDVLGAYGEGKALSDVVAWSSELLQWKDLSEVGVDPSSDPPWKVLLRDLLVLSEWGDGERRGRALKILRKLSHRLDHLADQAVEAPVTIADFCAAHGLLADTLRHRIRRHNARTGNQAIRPVGLGDRNRPRYDRLDLVRLLTEQERARCR